MRYSKIIINLISLGITIMIVSIIYFIPKLYVNQNQEIVSNNIEEIKIDNWEIKIPDLMINKKIIAGSKDTKIENEIIHYEKSFIKRGTIILLDKLNIDQAKLETVIFYRINDDIYRYKIVEKSAIRKSEIDMLLGEKNRIYILKLEGEKYVFIKCDYIGEI